MSTTGTDGSLALSFFCMSPPSSASEGRCQFLFATRLSLPAGVSKADAGLSAVLLFLTFCLLDTGEKNGCSNLSRAPDAVLSPSRPVSE